MKTITTILALAAVASVMVFAFSDGWWSTSLGALIEVITTLVILVIIFALGVNHGIEWEQRKRVNIFKTWKEQGW